MHGMMYAKSVASCNAGTVAPVSLMSLKPTMSVNSTWRFEVGL
jgi:hypothetical protein